MNSFLSLFRQLLHGKDDFVPSHSQYKRNLLSRRLTIVAFSICVFYIVLDLSSGIYYTWPYQGTCTLLLLTSWALSRLQKFNASNILLGISINLTVFIFSISEALSAGLSMLYIATSMGALAVYGYEGRLKAFAFIALSVTLFIIQLTTAIEFIPHVEHPEKYMVINYVINFFACTVSSVLIIYAMVKINYSSENSLKANEIRMTDQNNELIKINNELDRFVYSSSHDLRAPLTSAKGLIQLMELTDDPEEIKKCIVMMKDRLNSLDKFITDISHYSRNSRMEVIATQVNLKKAIREVLENLSYYPGSQEVKIEMHVPDDLFLTTDATRLQMILSNLISNSLKYRDHLKKEMYVRIQASASTKLIELSIEDNGIGIPEEHVSRIFEMFFQAHEKSVGSGLGLFIVKETIDKLKGEVQVQSEPGKGTQFRIRFPIA